MSLAAWAAISMATSLLTLHVANRIGMHDIARWITADLHHQLGRIGFAWQAITLAAACAITLSAEAWMADALSHRPWAYLIAALLCGVLSGLLLALARTDVLCRLLPDRLTLLLVATGVAFHLLVGALDLIDALMGAFAGYAALWFLAKLFRQIRNIEPMGRGDFAMTAGLGAWLGWQSLPLMLSVASMAALTAIAASRLLAGRRAAPEPSGSVSWMQIETAFGPALALGGLAAWMQLG
jgi:prepilin signal peptidase PulO-like enzyme (type II secretory pathway)